MPDVPSATRPGSKPGPVLIIEGDDSTRRAAETALKQQGYDVIVAASPAEGLEVVAASPVEAVLFGDKPPAPDALAFLGALADKQLDPPVIVVGTPAAPGSIGLSTARVVEVLRAGALDCLRKPLAAKGIVEAVARASALARRRRTKLADELERSSTARLVIPPPAAPPGRGARAQPLHPELAVIADGLKSRTVEVPAVPMVVAELRKAIRGQKSSLDDVARLIQRDQSLALDVLKIANSAVYARGARTSDLKTAVSRIGLTHLEGLIEMVFLRDCYQPRGRLFKLLLTEIWRYSVAAALAMRILADGAPPGPSRLDGGVAYAAGLLSDVGAAYLIWLISEKSPDLPVEVFLPFVRDRHELVGGQLMAAMSLDLAIAQLGMHHHAPSPPMGVSLYWSLAAVAGELCDRAVPAGDLTRNVRRGAAVVGQAADALRINEAAMRKAADQLDEELNGILEALA